MGVVLHIGRKTRRQYRTPVLVFRRGNRLIIALTYGRESQWVRNVLAENGCEFDTESRRLKLSQPNLFHDEHRGVMPAFVRFVLSLLNVSDFLEFTIADKDASR
jgi:deazaflavin-dependent oxidoreductase (nitroreductase family)